MDLSSKFSLEFCPQAPPFSCLLHRLVLASILAWALHMLTVDHCNCLILPAQLIYSKLKLDMALLCFYHISYKCFSGGPHVEKSLRASTVSVTPLHEPQRRFPHYKAATQSLKDEGSTIRLLSNHPIFTVQHPLSLKSVYQVTCNVCV